MKIVIFGLTISSSWGNGHATLWRGLCSALSRFGHQIVFFERDVSYYADHRDLHGLALGSELVLYRDFSDVLPLALRHLRESDVAMVTSYCPDGKAASRLVLEAAAGLRVFYDLDTPATLERVRRGEPVEYLPDEGLRDFDFVLSYTGGASLDDIQKLLGARRAIPLYGSVDPATHRPVPPVEEFRSSLSYLGTYAPDRQAALETLLVEPATRLREMRFSICGAQYPESFQPPANVMVLRHLGPADHPAFFCSSRATLNITRAAMAAYGYCPSGRLFEAAACGVPMVTDMWPGLELFFTPAKEIIPVTNCEDVIDALHRTDEELRAIAAAARERVLDEHTAECRARELERICEENLRATSMMETA